MLPGRTVIFSDGNDAFRRYRARSAQYQHHSRHEHLAVLNKHKLTDDDYKTGVLTRFEGRQARSCYEAGAQHEVLWLASSAALTDWNFQDVRHIIHYDLPSDEVTYVLRSTAARGARVTTCSPPATPSSEPLLRTDRGPTARTTRRCWTGRPTLPADNTWPLAGQRTGVY